MWQTERGRFALTVITPVAALLSLVISSPSFAAVAKVVHSRVSRTPPKTSTVVRKPTTAIVNPDRKVLVRLEDGQKTLEKQTADSSAAIQQQIGQLSGAIADARRATEEIMEVSSKRGDSILRYLKIAIALLVLLCGGLLYVAQKLLRLRERTFTWQGSLRPEPDDSEIVSWRKGEPPNTEEVGRKIVPSP